MTSDRLTRNELTWLLAQEARTAAQKLRKGVIIQDGPPGSVRLPDDQSTMAVESTLNQLEEAVGMLSSLHGHAAATRGRRGRIDIAALLWEVAPEARVQIEMGEGTTVFGDEAELRRMLLVLVGQAGDPTNAKGTSEVSVRRDKDEVKVSVVLGPDQPATFETERAWLSRMAIRYGGRLELDGAMQVLVLPADVDMQRQELETLKRELKAAQEQGEAYARELAQVFATSAKLSSSPPSASIEPVSSEGLAVLVAGMRGLVSELRGIFSAITRDLSPLRDRSGEVGEIVASAMRHVTAASETMADLARLGACPIGELPRHVDIAEALRDVVRDDMGRAARHDVRVTLTALQTAYEVVPAGALVVLMHALLDHAISASPPGTEVLVTLAEHAGGGYELSVADAGHPLPEAARTGVLSRDFEVLAAGRPSGISLITAMSVAAHVRMQLEIVDAPSGGACVKLIIPKMGA